MKQKITKQTLITRIIFDNDILAQSNSKGDVNIVNIQNIHQMFTL